MMFIDGCMFRRIASSLLRLFHNDPNTKQMIFYKVHVFYYIIHNPSNDITLPSALGISLLWEKKGVKRDLPLLYRSHVLYMGKMQAFLACVDKDRSGHGWLARVPALNQGMFAIPWNFFFAY
ncbi:MAG: hypothetical protein ACRDFB_01805 [Rhabdochlamydiaceae bacterium]